MDHHDPYNLDDLALLEDLRRIVDNSPYAARKDLPVRRPPCLFTMPLDPDDPLDRRVEWCRIPGDTPHHIHVSRQGVYRWTDSGVLLDTPHYGTEAFRAFYTEHPDGQGTWTGLEALLDAPGSVATSEGPPTSWQDFKSPFDLLAVRWKQYGNLPPVPRWGSRVGLCIGFLLILAVTAGLLGAIVLCALLVFGAFGAWLST
jgi:hypothetical protein